MSRRTRRRKPCPLCWDMGADAPAVTHVKVHRYPEGGPCIFSPPSGPLVVRVKVCEYHAGEARWSESPWTKVYRLKGGRK